MAGQLYAGHCEADCNRLQIRWACLAVESSVTKLQLGNEINWNP